VLILGGMKLAFGDRDRETTMQQADRDVLAELSVDATPSGVRARRESSDV
jgi:hypothetical protein